MITLDRQVYLKGTFDVPTDQLEAVMQALPTHIALSRAEAGCISFSVTPNQKVAGRFDVKEAFVDQDAFDAHQARNQQSAWFTITKDLPRQYTITTGAAKQD